MWHLLFTSHTDHCPSRTESKTSVKLSCDVVKHNIVYEVVNSIKPIIFYYKSSLSLSHLQMKFAPFTSYVISWESEAVKQ